MQKCPYEMKYLVSHNGYSLSEGDKCSVSMTAFGFWDLAGGVIDGALCQIHTDMNGG